MFLSSVMAFPPREEQTDNVVESLFQCEKYQKFRSNIALRKVVVDDDTDKVWSYYEASPRQNRSREIRCPVIFLPPVSGTADVFFYQILYLVEHGHRVLSLHYPTYYSIREFCNGFMKLLKHFNFYKVHIFGASLGGFLAQKFAQFNSSAVASLILCNSFGDTSRFKYVNLVPLFWFSPSAFLRRYFVSIEVSENDPESHKLAGNFMKWTLYSLNQQELVSRLSLNLTYDHVVPDPTQSIPVTIIDVEDECSNSLPTKIEMYKLYPNSRIANLKKGGNFPYLSNPDEVNLHLLVHLRRFNNTDVSASVHHLDVIPDIVEEGELPQ